MSEIELKPCPFCGWAAKRKDHGRGRTCVQCSNIECRAHSMLSLPGEDAVAAWNTRSQSERVSRLEEAAEVLKRINKVLSFGGSVEIGTELACRISEVVYALNQGADDGR